MQAGVTRKTLNMASLFKRNNGIYYVAYWDGNRRVWISTHTREREQADRLFQPIKDSLEFHKVLSLDDLGKKILKFAELNYKEGTVDLYRISLEHFIKCLGNRQLRFISAMDTENFKEYLLQRVKRVSANVYLRTLKTVFNTAIRLNLIDQNPFKNCKLFRIPVEEPAYIPKAEFAKLLIAIDDRRFRNLIVFAVLTGMRRGELVSLRWTDIDLTNRLIHIRNKDDFTAKGMRPRTVPMNQDLFGLLLKMAPESEHVFVDANGNPYHGPWVTKNFKRGVRRCGLPDKIHLHSLRHTYASWLVQSSTPLAEIQKLLGHSSVVTTQIYSHLEEEHLRGAAERIRLDQFAPKGLLD